MVLSLCGKLKDVVFARETVEHFGKKKFQTALNGWIFTGYSTTTAQGIFVSCHLLILNSKLTCTKNTLISTTSNVLS